MIISYQQKATITRKKFITSLLIGIVSTFSVTKAFELPNILETSVADNVIAWSQHRFNAIKEEGVCNFMVHANANLRTAEVAPQVQFATPLVKDSMNQRYLYRMEAFWLKIFESETNKQNDDKEEFVITKVGFSGRHLIRPNFMLGGYLFADWPNKKNAQSLPWMINLGLERIWPSQNKTITGDIIFHPKNFINPIKDYKNHFYKGSVKFSSLKPPALEIFAALSGTKYAGYNTEWLATFLGIKFQAPIHKWRIKRHTTVGARITYQKRSAWISLKNFGISVYLKINAFPPRSQNTLQYYLRMPIDRYIATPCHPSQYPNKSLTMADFSPASPIDLVDSDNASDCSTNDRLERDSWWSMRNVPPEPCQ